MTEFPIYVIYENPRDIPGKFVVRPWRMRAEGCFPDQEPHAVVDTLEEARAALPADVFPIGRMRQDDPVIVECWV